MFRRIGRIAVLIALTTALQVAPASGAEAGSAEPPDPAGSTISKSVAEQEKELQNEHKQIKSLNEEVDETHIISTVILGPIAVLVGILALGGSLGIVFSVRDQRRVSQLHELTVGGEILSQRRAEQSFASFFEQSQTTLALVNDTLELAKDATLEATESMKRRAQEQVGEIADKADDLLQRVYRDADFEKIVYESQYRTDLHAIADELRAVEGFLRLQEIPPPTDVKFIKAIDQFLGDDTEAAIRALRQLAQEVSTGELRRFTLFWLGYMSTTVSEYEAAIKTFEEDEKGLDEDDTERFQIECIINETRFFERAKKLREDKKDDSGRAAIDPLLRLRKVAPLLDRLREIAYEVAMSEDSHDRHHVSLEVARTRADIYVWIAYDPTHLNTQVEESALKAAREMDLGDLNHPAKELIRGDVEQLEIGKEALREQMKEGSEGALVFSRKAEGMGAETLRAWALLQAEAICQAQHHPNFDVAFALAECRFKLGEDIEAAAAIKEAENLLHNEFGDHMEQRRKASLRQSELICHRWLLHLKDKKKEERESEARDVRNSARSALEAAAEMHQSRVTVFSQIQRRNVSKAEFVKEVEAIAVLPEDTKKTDANKTP